VESLAFLPWWLAIESNCVVLGVSVQISTCRFLQMEN
jgi:hypothetical protein